MNTQPIEKREPVSLRLQVHSIFYTIQGEGPFAGTPAVFVRLAGCNLQCPYCDTDYTSKRENLTPIEIVQRVTGSIPRSLWQDHKRMLVVITGGEPFRQNLGELFDRLVDAGYYVQVETNGTLPPPAHIPYSQMTDARRGVYIVCSPKTGKLNPLIALNACCFKYVLDHTSVSPNDGLPDSVLGLVKMSSRVARPPSDFRGPVYVQPQDDKREDLNELNKHAAVISCLTHGYVLQLQIHKLIGVE